MVAHNHGGFTDNVIGQELPPEGFEMAITPALLSTSRHDINRLHGIKLPKNPSSTIFGTAKRKMSQHYLNDNINSFNNTNSFNNVWNYTVADEKSEILAWLSPLVFDVRSVVEEREGSCHSQVRAC